MLYLLPWKNIHNILFRQQVKNCLSECFQRCKRKFNYVHAKLLQSCPILCNPIDGSPPCSPVPGILQARTLEWVAISFSNAGKWKVKVKSLSYVGLFATPWTAAHQAPPSMGFSRREYWSGVPLPSLHTYTTMCKIAHGNLLGSTGSSVQCSAVTWMGRLWSEGGRCKREGIYVYK